MARETSDILHGLAKKAAEDAGKNARVAPELLIDHILWTLEAAEEAGVLSIHKVGDASDHE